VRSAEGMVPTVRAQELEGPLRSALAMLEAALDPPAEFDPSRATLTFGLACDAVQQVILLPRLLDRLARDAPGVVLHTEAPVGAHETYRRLASGRLDLAIGRFEDPPAGIHREVLTTDRIVYVARKGHPRIRKALSKADVRRERLLVQAPATAGETSATLRTIHQLRESVPEMIAATPHLLASLFIVSQTDLVTGTVERVAEMYKDVLGLAVFPAPSKLRPIDTHIAWHQRSLNSPAHRWMLARFQDPANQG
jgi:DNA-binding transcriptional LysR family regulator